VGEIGLLQVPNRPTRGVHNTAAEEWSIGGGVNHTFPVMGAGGGDTTTGSWRLGIMRGDGLRSP